LYISLKSFLFLLLGIEADASQLSTQISHVEVYKCSQRRSNIRTLVKKCQGTSREASRLKSEILISRNIISMKAFLV
jgi:hypothetical protein